MNDLQIGFEYKLVDLADMQLDIVNYTTRHSKSTTFPGGKMVKSIIIDGETITPTGRFWESLFSKYGLNTSFFKFFKFNEVFTRLSERGLGKVRVCIERGSAGSKLLAITGLNKPVIIYDDLMEILDQLNLQSPIKYDNGIISSTHAPAREFSPFDINGDAFSNQFVMHAPVDGYGSPNIYLSLLRQICSNGAVGFANCFKTSLALGTGSDSIRFTLKRALDSFNNEEGYAQLRDRFQVSMNSWASVNEHQDLYRLLLKVQGDSKLQEDAPNIAAFDSKDLACSPGNALLQSYRRTVGDPFEQYKVTDQNTLSVKKQRALPIRSKVYSLLNYATELSTHHLSEHSSRIIQGWVGEMLSNDFDLENSCDTYDNWQDIFLGKK